MKYLVALVALASIASPRSGWCETLSERELEAQKLMAKKANAKSGEVLMQYLTERGLSEVDARETIDIMLMRQATCTIEALRIQSGEQSIDFELMLQKFSTGLRGVEKLEATQSFDMRAFTVLAKPCMDAAATDAGLRMR